MTSEGKLADKGDNKEPSGRALAFAASGGRSQREVLHIRRTVSTACDQVRCSGNFWRAFVAWSESKCYDERNGKRVRYLLEGRFVGDGLCSDPVPVPRSEWDPEIGNSGYYFTSFKCPAPPVYLSCVVSAVYFPLSMQTVYLRGQRVTPKPKELGS